MPKLHIGTSHEFAIHRPGYALKQNTVPDLQKHPTMNRLFRFLPFKIERQSGHHSADFHAPVSSPQGPTAAPDAGATPAPARAPIQNSPIPRSSSISSPAADHIVHPTTPALNPEHPSLQATVSKPGRHPKYLRTALPKMEMTSTEFHDLALDWVNKATKNWGTEAPSVLSDYRFWASGYYDKHGNSYIKKGKVEVTYDLWKIVYASPQLNPATRALVANTMKSLLKHNFNQQDFENQLDVLIENCERQFKIQI